MIVLDPENEVVKAFMEEGTRVLYGSVTAALHSLIRAQTKPPRMAEPSWQPQVTAYTPGVPERRRFTRYTAHGMWIDQYGTPHPWVNLIDPEPLP